MAMYFLNSDPVLYNYAVEWGNAHNWGLRSGTSTRNADDQCCGQAYIELYTIDPQYERIRDITTCISNMVNSSKIDDWSWIDAIQMAMPVFAKLGVLHDDTGYFDKMYSYTKRNHGTNGLYNTEDHLWWRDANFDPPYTEPNGEDCYWSRGNGWVFGTHARVLDVLPSDDPYRDEYIQTFRDMAEALRLVQRSDGFWNVSLHDPNNYGGKETSGTSFFVYGMAWGINNGFLSADTYLPAVVLGWNGLVNDAVHPDGFLGYVQGTGKEPASAQPVTYTRVPNFEDFGTGIFLLAGSEVYKLADQGTPAPSSLGDVNNDGAVTIVDALRVAQFYVGLNPQDFQEDRADVDCDGSIDIVDALLIARLYVGLITAFPCS
jgi:unsaturated rhamnogalacturonyl hydrolase